MPATNSVFQQFSDKHICIDAFCEAASTICNEARKPKL
jgi:hypothetical protein